MKRKILIVAGVIYVGLIIEFILYLSSDSDSETPVRIESRSQVSESNSNQPLAIQGDTVPFNNQSSSRQAATSNISTDFQQPVRDSQSEQSTNRIDIVSDRQQEQERIEYADTEEIKKKIYNMNIEYIEDLESLEQIVQTGDTNQAEFWKGDWYSVDDWKRRHDSFQLKINEQGSFSFATGDRLHKPSQAFTFDHEKREFYWEEDYYGKIISHRAKFITPDTLLIIKTSGVKVNLDIYEKAEN